MSNEHLEHIRAALSGGVDDLTRQRGLNACRAIIAVLGAGASPATAGPAALPIDAGAAASNSTARIAGSMPPTLILDAVIAKLKAHLADESNTATLREAPVLRIPFIPVPTLGGAG